MSDYISREEAIMAVTRAKLPDTTPDGVPIANGKRSVTDCIRRIKDIPAADVRPVVRGKWEQKEVFEAKGHVDELQSAFCPVCQRYHTTPYSYYFTQYNYCPNCGADMRGEQDV